MTIRTTQKSRGLVVATNAVRVRGTWTGGGAATAMTRSTGRHISSVAYNSATGAYLITFSSVGQVFLGAFFSVLSASGTTTAYVCHPIAYSATNRTLSVFITDLATPTGHDLSTSEQLMIDAEWDDSDAA